MGDLTSLQNIGNMLAEKLTAIGITTSQELKALGSENAIIRIATIENSGTCINMLFALEGAIQGIRWHELTKEKKEELKAFYHMLKKVSL